MSITIINAECREALATLPAASVHCIITSPPYYSLRNYDCAGQIGLEATPREYSAALVDVFAAAWRVLRDDGLLWVNLGDSYAGHGRMVTDVTPTHDLAAANARYKNGPSVGHIAGYRRKNLLGIPWRVAFALQDAGWILRQDIIWSKPTCMPEAVADRCTRSHEYIFMFSKQERYYYDADAIRSPLRPKTLTTFGTTRHSKGTDALAQVKAHNWSRDVPERQPRLDAEGNHAGANKRSVWTVASEPSASRDTPHYAAFPPKLVEPMILAGTSEAGCCPRCSAPYRRMVERTGHVNGREAAHQPGNTPTKTDSTGWAPTTRATDHWQAGCSCDAGPPLPCTVLDIFCGSGTTGVVAKRYGRNFIGIELNESYCALSEKRIAGVCEPLFTAATVGSSNAGAAR